MSVFLYQVEPKIDCPHVATNVSPMPLHLPSRLAPCHQCPVTGETWLCLTCYQLHCSRQDAGHGAMHAEESKHHVSVSFADLSAWCYACDAYIKADEVFPILGRLHENFFGVPNPAIAPKGSEEGQGRGKDKDAAGADVPRAGNGDSDDTTGLAAAVSSISLGASSSSSSSSSATSVAKGAQTSPSAPASNPASSSAPTSSSTSVASASASAPPSSSSTAPSTSAATVPIPASVPSRRGGPLRSRTLEAVADYIREKNVKRIVLLTGAGVSTAAGILDFRSPGTGLYHNLEKYNLPDPMAIFTLSFFAKNPKPFYTLAKELYPANFKPTYSHHFVKLLENKGLLQRNFTQNIDTLERAAGVSDNMLVEAHGSFATSHCIDCGQAYDTATMEAHIMAEKVPLCPKCGGYAKPDIVFFGENLPERFFKLSMTDLDRADLLIVMGTSLKVAPFCHLPTIVRREVPRVLINNERVGENMFQFDSETEGNDHDESMNRRDVHVKMGCDEAVVRLCELLGWKEDLVALANTRK